jgi:hypothetical protein
MSVDYIFTLNVLCYGIVFTSSHFGRYNDVVCDYKLPLAHMLDNLFHTIC